MSEPIVKQHVRQRKATGKPIEAQAAPLVAKDLLLLKKQLQELNPTPEQFNLQKRLSPQLWHQKRESMLTELLEEEGPGDNLVLQLQNNPLNYNPEFLEQYRRVRDVRDELVVQRTREIVQANVQFREESLALNEKYSPEQKVTIGNLKNALKRSKEELEAFDENPVRLHSVARWERNHPPQEHHDCG